MDWTRRMLKSEAKRALKANRWRAVLAGVIMILILSSPSLFIFLSFGYTTQRIAHMTDSDAERMVAVFSPDEIERLANLDMDSLSQADYSIIGALFGASYVLYGGWLFLIAWTVLKLALLNHLEAGCQRFFAKCGQQDVVGLSEIVYPLKYGYLNVLKVLFLRDLYIFLWSMLFTIPGIVKTYSYRMVPYLLGENPNMAAKEVFRVSRVSMNGQKFKAFLLDLSFFGWILLSSITLHLLYIFYVCPYQFLTGARLYHAVCAAANQYDLWIVCVDGPLRGSAFPLTELQAVTIGRGNMSVFQFPPFSAGVSRDHARVEWHNGTLTLTDCGSTYGTFLDSGVRVMPGQSVEIMPGMEFCIGSRENRFLIRR